MPWPAPRASPHLPMAQDPTSAQTGALSSCPSDATAVPVSSSPQLYPWVPPSWVPFPREVPDAWGWSCPTSPPLPCSLAGRPCPASPRAPAAPRPQGATSSYGSLAPVPCGAAPQSLLFLPLPKTFLWNPHRNLLRIMAPSPFASWQPPQCWLLP